MSLIESSTPPSPLPPTILVTIFAISISLPCLLARIRKQAGHVKKAAPEAGGSWPILGHLRLLGGPKPPHLVLAQMADKYGPLFTIRLGIRRAIVVNTWEIAKECLTTHDRIFASRPRSVSSEVLGYNYANVGQSSYGPYWRDIRKISIHELLSVRRVELLSHIRESEVLTSVRGLCEKYQTMKIGCDAGASSMEETKSTVLVDMKKWFRDVTVNIVLGMIVGRRFSDEDEGNEKGRQAMREFFDLMGTFVVSDGLPFLRWLDLGGYETAMRRNIEELDRLVQGWLDEHKVRRKLREEAGEADAEQDFMDVVLSILKDKERIHSYDADTVNKATCMAMVLAASDTTIVTLTWALSLLLNHREALKKAQRELDALVGKDRRVSESDLKNLPYLQAVIKETLRLYPAAPLSIPHESTEDCNVSGYFIPKGTRLILNLHKIHRDPLVWPEMSEFRPERFLTTHKHVNLRGQNFELIPFSSGRRMCPGVSLALQVMGLVLGSFLHAFDIMTPGDEAVDMEETMGATNLKASPLEVLITPRIPDHIYQ